MTPTPKQIVDAAKRAGIPVRIMTTGRVSPGVPSFDGWLCIAEGPDHYYVDQPEGSALFIVAVLGVLPCALACRSYSVDGKWVGWDVHWVGGDDDPLARADTLTEACACALVAAYPEKPTDE